MIVLNTTTNEPAEITLDDIESGIEWTIDAISNSGDLKYNEDTDQYEMDQSGIDWWTQYADGMNPLEPRKKELVFRYGEDHRELFEALEKEWINGAWNDMEFEPEYKKKLLDDLEKEIND